ncbi:MAG: glycosyl transferase [Candidatus Saccharibacteria bacterium]|nr:glycosyl transferase [Candidatus Saccharibacteria bacterium]
MLKRDGVLQLSIQSLQKLEKNKKAKSPRPADKIQYVSLVAREDVLKADWSNAPYVAPQGKHTAPYTINWVMSPPSSGGGHQNIFRFIEFLDSKGYKNNVYIYSTYDNMTIGQARDNVKAYCKAKNLTFRRYKGSMVDADVVFATGWETAYPVFNDSTTAKKMYFVQDFEPYFYPIGTDYVLAENTYKFGFHGITAGGFLSDKLSKDYGMSCDHYDFGAETNLYKHTNNGERKEIFFYARPVTERRGFDLGIMALEIFHKQMPEYTINLAGWDVSGWDVPFPYVNHKTMRLEQLSNLYNQSAAALVISLTNMSLLPLELLACGTIPVVNDGKNNRLVSNNPNIVYVEPSPSALAKALVDTVRSKDITKKAALASASVKNDGWGTSCQKFEDVLVRELTNG